ncbi:hypothetical protein [Cytobacillus luteolus]|uniref:hypothetical protein n=1 Tax=Litchfieldia luteola TaxID=682179 RepID=UPI001AE9353A|nr:hypothetical protein [Cytobacillus luteolus]MBP1944642.1 hypothetical protein [Cytobacillus luteolus]
MEKELYIGDLNDHVGTLAASNTVNTHFESYELEKDDEEVYIVGKKGYKAEEVEVDNINFLLSLINLVKGDLPKQYYSAQPNINKLDTVISDEDILKWVQNYGFPYLESENIVKLNLNKFKRKLAMLNARFLMWKAIFEENDKEIKKYKSALLTLDKNKKLHPELSELSITKKALAEDVGTWGSVTVRLRYDEKTDSNIFYISAKNQLDIAYYQLGMLMTKKDTENKKRLRYCANGECNSMFWTKHSRTKFCNNCDRRKVHYENNKKHGSS